MASQWRVIIFLRFLQFTTLLLDCVGSINNIYVEAVENASIPAEVFTFFFVL